MMRVNVDGDKYTICMEGGKVWIERHGEPWITDPLGAKAWISVAYELACLRRVAKEAIKLVEYTDKGGSGRRDQPLRGLYGHPAELGDPWRNRLADLPPVVGGLVVRSSGVSAGALCGLPSRALLQIGLHLVSNAQRGLQPLGEPREPAPHQAFAFR